MGGGYDDRDGKIWVDGTLVDWRLAQVHVLTHAMHYASSVFEGNFDRSRFENKYVLIGTSAQGLFDLVKTPLGIIMPGVEVHANVIENILDKSYLLRNPEIYLIELLLRKTGAQMPAIGNFY